MKTPKVPVDSQDIILYIYAKIRLSPEISFLSYFCFYLKTPRKSDKTPFHIRGHICYNHNNFWYLFYIMDCLYSISLVLFLMLVKVYCFPNVQLQRASYTIEGGVITKVSIFHIMVKCIVVFQM